MTIYSLDVLLSQFWNQSVVPCSVLTVASWPAYRFLRRQVRWSGIPISLRIFHSLLWCTVKEFGIVNKAEVDVFLELSWLFDDPEDLAIWSLVPLSFLKPAWTFGSSRFTYCWSLAWRILSITSVWDECNCAVAWTFFGIGMKTDLFQSYGHCRVFQICWHTECSTFTISKEQACFNFMAVVTIQSDFGAQENRVCHCFHCLPIYLPWSDGIRCHDLCFWTMSFKPTFSLSSFTFIKKLFSSLLSAIRVVSSVYLRLLIFLPAILIPACNSL